MILDATAGNRVMWLEKKTQNIIYMDVERDLKRNPDLFADVRQIPFKDAVFDTVYFDPPWITRAQGCKYWFNNPQKGSFYGMDITGSGLTKLLYEANKELCRILKDDGLLFLKWNEDERPLRVPLTILDKFKPIMIQRIIPAYPYHPGATKTKRGKGRTYWTTLVKQKVGVQNETL